MLHINILKIYPEISRAPLMPQIFI